VLIIVIKKDELDLNNLYDFIIIMFESFGINVKPPCHFLKPPLSNIRISLKQATRYIDFLSPRLHNNVIFMHDSLLRGLPSLTLLDANNVTKTNSMKCSTACTVTAVGINCNHFRISVEFDSSRSGHAQTHTEEWEWHQEDFDPAGRLEGVGLLGFQWSCFYIYIEAIH